MARSGDWLTDADRQALAFSSEGWRQVRARCRRTGERIWAGWWWPWIIIGLGILFRLARYLTDRSLWLDEASLALNIVDKPWSAAFQPLAYAQGAPVGFLLLEHAAVRLLGNSELALRLVPFVASVIAIVLFWPVCRAILQPNAVPLALILMATSSPLIYFAGEVKQYSSDVAIALALILVWLHTEQQTKIGLGDALLFGSFGAVGLWFSHPAAFSLAGLGIASTATCLLKRDWKRLRAFVGAYALWAGSFIAFFFVSLRNLGENPDLQRYWNLHSAFAPLPTSFSSLEWYEKAFLHLLENPAGLYFPGLAAVALIVGSVVLFKEDKRVLTALVAPLLVTLCASSLRQYPFSERLILFVAPAVLLLVAVGTAEICAKTRSTLPLLGIVFVALLLFNPVTSSVLHLRGFDRREDIKPVLSYVQDHRQDGDLVYVYYGAERAFKYYSGRYGFSDGDYVFGVRTDSEWQDYYDDLDRLRGRGRVWVLFSHVTAKLDADEETLFRQYLGRIGTQRDQFKSTGAAVYLYDLRQP